MCLEQIYCELEWECTKLSQLRAEAEENRNYALAQALDSIYDGVQKATGRMFKLSEKLERKKERT